MLVQAVVLTASVLAGPRPSPSGQPIAAYLAPVDESVLGREFSAVQIERTLRDRLTRRTPLRLVDERTPGGMRLQVMGCARVQESRAKKDPKRHPPVTLPPGTPRAGTILEKDEEYGVSFENRTFVVLYLRVVWEDEVRELSSGEDDLTLEAAASTVAREIEKLVKRKRR